MDIDDQAAVETIVLGIEIDGPGRAPALFDDFSTLEGDRRLSRRLDDVLAVPACTCGRRVRSALRDLFADARDQRSPPPGHVCQIIPFPRRTARPAPAVRGDTERS